MSIPFSLMDEFAAKHLSSAAYLRLPQVAWPTAAAEQFFSSQAEQGYLLVSVADDVVEHGDAQFRQSRGAAAVAMPGAAFWPRNLRFHNWLCEQDQPHLPIRLGPGPDEPMALLWLIPAPQEGRLTAAGYSQPWKLDAGLREQWLLTWAERIGKQHHPASRLLLQLPGAGPAYWHYRNYRGDVALPGSLVEQARLFLGGLPRYLASQPEVVLSATPAMVTDWPLLVNEPAATWGEENERQGNHGELSLFFGNRY